MRRFVKQIFNTSPDATEANNEHYLKEYANPAVEFARVYEMRKQFMVKINQPLVMVTQVQRSGGTLMSQLFDGHPECYAHPYELYIGYPEKYNYPDLDLSATPEQWFELLYETPSLKHFRDGYQKFPDSAQYDKQDIFPFLLLPNLQRELFLHAVSESEIKTQRDVLDCYWTSYFNAWVDYHGWGENKRFVTGFVPRVNMDAGNISRFFRDYPDGKLVSVIRDPKGWYGSSHKKGPKNYPNPQVSMPIWNESAQAMLRNKQNYGDRVFLISFDGLLKDTETTIRKLADWIGLTWDDILTQPTFQNLPIKANTAYSTSQYGVIDTPLQRHKNVSDEDAAYIDQHSTDLYQQVLALVD